MPRKPFTAVPLRIVHSPPATAPRNRYYAGRLTPSARRATPWSIMIAPPLAVFTAVYLWPTGRESAAIERPRAVDRESGFFDLCRGGERVTCVVDGDTIWYRGEKIRLADINAPEVSSPGCAREAELGEAATLRLLELLHEAPFTVAPNADGSGRDQDTYGRSLRTLTRDGQSLGTTLVREGLAEEWQGWRREWC